MQNQNNDNGDGNRLTTIDHIEKIKAQMTVFARHAQMLQEIINELKEERDGKSRKKEAETSGKD